VVWVYGPLRLRVRTIGSDRRADLRDHRVHPRAAADDLLRLGCCKGRARCHNRPVLCSSLRCRQFWARRVPISHPWRCSSRRIRLDSRGSVGACRCEQGCAPDSDALPNQEAVARESLASCLPSCTATPMPPASSRRPSHSAASGAYQRGCKSSGDRGKTRSAKTPSSAGLRSHPEHTLRADVRSVRKATKRAHAARESGPPRDQTVWLGKAGRPTML
jgi:hypothetical protein